MFSLSLSSHPQDLASSRMRLLYLAAGAGDMDATTAKQLAKVESNAEVVSVDSVEQALAELRKDGARFRALVRELFGLDREGDNDDEEDPQR